MSRKTRLTVVFCETPGCKWFMELDHELSGSISEKLERAGWSAKKSSETGLVVDYCPKCTDKRKQKKLEKSVGEKKT